MSPVIGFIVNGVEEARGDCCEAGATHVISEVAVVLGVINSYESESPSIS